MPHLVFGANYVQFALSATETADSANLSFAQYLPKRIRGCDVSITEIRVGNMARVSITDLKDDVP
jgi:hypothetical protein